MRKRILNVGCGNDRYGTNFIDLYPSRHEVIKCNIDEEKLPFPANTFDEVFVKSLIEHLKNVGFFLSDVKRVLKNGGKVIVITDNAHFLGYHIKGTMHTGGYERHGRIGGGSGSFDRHYALFTPNHLRNYLETSGFKNIEIRYETFAQNTTVKFKNVLIMVFSKISKKLGSTLIVAEAKKIG